MPGAKRTRSFACEKKAHDLVHRRSAATSGIPCAMVVGLYALSPVSGLVSHRRRRARHPQA